jgi:hypothetical protein
MSPPYRPFTVRHRNEKEEEEEAGNRHGSL